MLDVFSTSQEKVDGFAREMLLALSDFSMDEIDRAATAVIRREEFFPKPSTMLKYLDAERQKRRTGVVVAPGFGDWKTDLAILRAWVMGYQLDFEYWRRVVPLRLKPNGEGAPGGAEYDDVLAAWLPKADPAAIAGLQDEILEASGPWSKGEPETIARLRRALHYDAKEFVGGLTPSERVEKINARRNEIQAERRRAGA